MPFMAVSAHCNIEHVFFQENSSQYRWRVSSKQRKGIQNDRDSLNVRFKVSAKNSQILSVD